MTVMIYHDDVGGGGGLTDDTRGCVGREFVVQRLERGGGTKLWQRNSQRDPIGRALGLATCASCMPLETCKGIPILK
jgi:hypothetical protein